MRKLGHVLMWLGFLAAAFVSMEQSDQISWGRYVPPAIVGVVGVVLLRRTAGAEARHVDVVRTNLQTLERSLHAALDAIRALNAGKDDIYVYDVHGRIDAEVAPDMGSFADARESMIHGIGLAEYAEVMDHFARGERLLNRAWSASADGYIDEVWRSLEQCEGELTIADDALRRHLGAKAA